MQSAQSTSQDHRSQKKELPTVHSYLKWLNIFIIAIVACICMYAWNCLINDIVARANQCAGNTNRCADSGHVYDFGPPAPMVSQNAKVRENKQSKWNFHICYLIFWHFRNNSISEKLSFIISSSLLSMLQHYNNKIYIEFIVLHWFPVMITIIIISDTTIFCISILDCKGGQYGAVHPKGLTGL